MTPERYRQINALADAALQMAPAQRAVFLSEACGSDHELRRQIEALLTAETGADGFLERPLLEVLAGDLAAQSTERDLTGMKIANYEVLSRLGAGGIGEVWLARDLRLNREIALKLLSPKFAGDPYHLHRFQQEARTASALNHPNIVTVHEIGETDGVLFIAEERVEGETIRQLLANGPIPLRTILEIAMQAAAGLNAAHAAGVIHRDIKPENAMVRPDGLLKLLDFGLARFGRTATNESGSLQGLVIGTVRYMSPEQARGLAVDARSDIFSLGVMLYEMASGVAPFTGSTPTDTLAAILTGDPPPLARSMPEASLEFERIVRRCLAKDPDKRYASAEALRADLALLTSKPAKRKKALLPWTIGVVGLLLLAVYFLKSAKEPQATFGSMQMARLATRGEAIDAAISHDGRRLAYVTSEAQGQSVWIKESSDASERAIVAAEQGEHSGIVFSPDDQFLYYRRRRADSIGDLYRVSVHGDGPPVRVLGDVSGAVGFSPDGRRLAFVRLNPSTWEASLVVANAGGGGVFTLATLQRPKYFDQHTVAWSPDGRSIACFAGEGRYYSAAAFRLVAVSLADGKTRILSQQLWAWPRSVAWAAKGDALVATAAARGDDVFQLWLVRAGNGTVSRITNDLNNYDRVTLANDGNSLVSLESETSAAIWVAAKSGNNNQFKRINAIPLHSSLTSLCWTNDERLIYSDSTEGYRNLSLVDADGTNRKPITTGETNKDHCVMSPDGRFIVYKQLGNIWLTEMNGGATRQLTHGLLDVHADINANDGSIVYASFTEWSPGIGGQPTLWKIPSSGGQAIEISRQPGSYPKVSSDGKQLAFLYFPGKDPRFSSDQIATLALDGSDRFTVFEASPSEGTPIAWAPGAKAVDYVVNAQGLGNVWRQPTNGGVPAQITHFDSDQLFTFAWSPKGRLACIRGNTTGSVVAIKNFH